MAVPSLFIASTDEDLKATGHRQAILSAVLNSGLNPVMSEHWAKGQDPPLETCLEKVASADALIVAVAYRYGSIPEGEQRSFTWFECEQAYSLGKKVFYYAIDAQYEFPFRHRDISALQEAIEKHGSHPTAEAHARALIAGMRDFKKWLSATFNSTPFTAPDNLRQQVEIDLLRWMQSRDSTTGSFPWRDGSHMLRVPAGEFWMGSDDDYQIEKRKETLDVVYISKYPITNAQYRRFVQETGHETGGQPWWTEEDPDHPVVCVSWEDAEAYCRWAQLSLPNEYQWEKAARGIDGRKYPWGDFGPVEIRANCLASEVGGTTSVHTYEKNSVSPNGCADMVGNAFEWCLDQYTSRPRRNCVADNTVFRVVRGGAWNDVADRCRCSYRDRRWQKYRFNNVGFRVVFTGITLEMVDGWFGENNWFCYPDRRTGVGVTKLPKLERKPELIDNIEVDGTIYRNFDCIVPELGANVELRLPLDDKHTPEWQRGDLAEWKEERQNDDRPLNRERLDELFQTCKWSRHPKKTFVVDVCLTEPLKVRYPITGVADSEKLSYGIGTVCAAGEVRVFLAGDLPEEFVPSIQSR